MSTPFYITTAIDYANGEPHHGHAYEKIGADAIARYQRLAGRTVHFLTGLDEHGQKVAQTAEARGLAPQAFVDEIAAAFEAMWKRLDISYDQFIRTTDAAHKRGVRDLIERIHARNPDDFYEQTYEGWYCVGCELFKREGEIVDGHCVLHPTRELQWTAERNWFFRLTKYAEFLRAHFAAHAEFLRPESRRNEILGLLDQGLEDISITRSRLSWAIPFPIDSSSGEVQGTWVWFDALPNYLTATGYPDAGFDARWPAQLHVIGKDITRLHAVIWPAMLRAAELPLPAQIWAHGFVLLGGERFSKSSGVKLDLGEAIDRYGVDALRYFLLREVPFDGDGNFSWERFDERYTADLANAFGNLASRVIAMVEKYFAGTVPPRGADTLAARTREHLAAYHAHVDGRDGYFLNEGLQALWQIVGDANEYVQSSAPWTLAKDPARRDELATVLHALVRELARLAVGVAPFMPTKAQALWEQLGGAASGAEQVSAMRFAQLDALDVAGWTVRKGAALFPRPESGA